MIFINESPIINKYGFTYMRMEVRPLLMIT